MHRRAISTLARQDIISVLTHFYSIEAILPHGQVRSQPPKEAVWLYPKNFVHVILRASPSAVHQRTV
jgi:hypothetical protein